MSKESYSEYADWKQWSGHAAPSEEQVRYFEKEFDQSGVPESGRLLEIGFGRGELMHWAREKGYSVGGVELIPELVESLQSKGFQACAANLANEVPVDVQQWGPYDVIVGLDVMEHLTPEEAISLLKNLYPYSVAGCRMVLRFPNGESPFSARVQNGDHTHRQWVTRSKLEQYCVGNGWSLVSYSNAARVFTYRGLKGLMKRLVFPLRNLLEVILGGLYWSARVPLDPVATAVLVREE